MATGAFILLFVGTLFWLAYRQPRRRRWLLPRPSPLAVNRSDAPALTVESAENRFRTLLAVGGADAVRLDYRPGQDLAVQVEALTRIGTADATRVLERQLDVSLPGDRLGQTRLWVKVAAGLRRLDRRKSLPKVLRCAVAAEHLPAGVELSIQALAFPNLRAAVSDWGTPTSRLGLRVLTNSGRVCRDGGSDRAAFLTAGLGEHLASISASAPPLPDPWLTRALLEAERICRRLDRWIPLLSPADQDAARRHHGELLKTSARRADWLAGSAQRLMNRYSESPVVDHLPMLKCLAEIRADVSNLLRDVPNPRSDLFAAAVRCLTWAKSPSLGPLLADRTGRVLHSWRLAPAAVELLGSLRGHRCPEAEAVLLAGAASRQDTVRAAALGGLGWWDPYDADDVIDALESGRSAASPAVRRAAVGALARLGSRSALGEFRAGLTSDESAIRQSTSMAVAEEGLTWLWPELEAIAGGIADETSIVAAEAIERLREQLFPLTS